MSHPYFGHWGDVFFIPVLAVEQFCDLKIAGFVFFKGSPREARYRFFSGISRVASVNVCMAYTELSDQFPDQISQIISVVDIR